MLGKQVEDIGLLSAEQFLNSISIELQQQINFLKEDVIEKRRAKENSFKNLPKGTIHKFSTSFDYLQWAPTIQDLLERVREEDPSVAAVQLKQATIAGM